MKRENEKTQYYKSVYTQPERMAFSGGHPTLTPYRKTVSCLTMLLISNILQHLLNFDYRIES
jgi:hypothetical protein